MPIIEEYNVIIKKFSVDDLKQLFGEGVKDVRVRVTWKDSTGLPSRSMVNSSMELVIETWEPKTKEKK